MDALPQPATLNTAVHLISLANSTGHLAQALRGFDPGHVIGAHETDPADYLNQPDVTILARSGLSAIPASVPIRRRRSEGSPTPSSRCSSRFQLDGVWQGTAAMAAGANDLGLAVRAARQSTSLVKSFSTAAASVKQAEGRPIAVTNDLRAPTANIGANKIVPWGIAEINEAVTATAEVITETQRPMGAQSSTSLDSYELGDHVDRQYAE